MPKYCLMSSSFSTFIVVILLQLINTNSCLKFWKSPLICLFSFTHTISNPFSTWWLGILYHKHTWSHNSSALNSSLVFFTHKLKYNALLQRDRPEWTEPCTVTSPPRPVCSPSSSHPDFLSRPQMFQFPFSHLRASSRSVSLIQVPFSPSLPISLHASGLTLNITSPITPSPNQNRGLISSHRTLLFSFIAVIVIYSYIFICVFVLYLFLLLNSDISGTSFIILTPKYSSGLGDPDCRVKTAASAHLCDGSLDGHGVDPCHGWIATIL